MISVVGLDFEKKTERAVEPREVRRACDSGLFCWVDMTGEDLKACETCLNDLGINGLARAEILGEDRECRYDVYEDCLHFAVTEGRLESNRLITMHVDVVLSGRFLITFHRQDAEFIKQIKRTYREDFVKFAKTPGFLLYEIGDHLTERYRRSLQSFAEAVEQTQLKLFAEVDDQIFRHVSGLTTDILMLRKIVMASREVFHELATRRSPFIPEATQPYLENMAGTLDRLGADVSTERDALSNTLGLYMGMVSHRTNKIVSRLTVISVIFLPLSFLVSLYGSNFRGIPGTASPYGFAVFCLACLAIAGALLLLMRRRHWL